jgi:outer membrane protein
MVREKRRCPMNKAGLLLAFAVISVDAAELTLSQALREALEHNPGYQASKNDVRYFDAARDSALAGYLPTITATGGVNRSWLDSHQERATSSGTTITDKNGAQSTSRTAGVNMNWTLFQGFSAPLNHRRLRLQFDQALAYEGGSREGLLFGTALAYADLARQIRLYHALDTLAVISEERLRIIERNQSAGAASRSDWLSARVDLNADRAALQRQEASLQSARVSLGQMLGRGGPAFENVDSVALPAGSSDLETLLPGLPDHRPDLKLAETSRALAEVSVRQRATNWLPRVDALAGYNYSLTNSPANVVLESRTLGPSVGLQLNFNLFTGEFPWRAYQRARIALTSAELRKQDATASAGAEVMEAFAAFRAADSALALDREGLGYARENLGLTFTRWKSGSLAYLDARRAQEQYLDAFTRTENTAFDALRARLDLLRAGGRLGSLVDSSSVR